MRKKLLFIILLLFVLFGNKADPVLGSENADLVSPQEEIIGMLNENPLLSKEFLQTIILNPNIEKDEPLLNDSCVSFLENYDETYTLLGERSLQIGEDFYVEYKAIFHQAYELHGIAPEYILGILRIETYFGICTGRHLVLPRLYDLYTTTPQKKEFALREMEAFLELTLAYGWDPFTVRGSSMGAIGIPQFLPSSIKNFAVDGNGNGKIDMFEIEDVIPSVAHYLSINHFKVSKRAGIWNYNRSEKYVRNVLQYAEKIAEKINNPSL